MNELGCFNMNSNWILIAIVAYFVLTQCGGTCGILDNVKGIFGGCGEGNNWIWIIAIFFLFCQKDFAC